MTPVVMPSAIRSTSAARDDIAHDLDSTLVVEAAAGTGKTTELVNRILRVLATGRAAMVEIVAVTFTEKAAGELKLRLREALEQARAEAGHEAERSRLEQALETLEEAHVNTIHGFCADLLRERPVEAAVDPLFAVLTEQQSGRIYDRAFRAWLQETLKNPPEGVRRALRRSSMPAFGAGGARTSMTVRSAGCARRDGRWPRRATIRRRGSGRSFDRPHEIERLVEALHHLADLSARASNKRDNLYFDLDAVRRLSKQIRLEQGFGNHDLDGWEARLVDLVRDRGFSRTRKGSGYKYGGDVTRTDVLAARDALFNDLQQFKKEADADLAAALQQELKGATERYVALEVGHGRARLHRPAGARARSDPRQRRGPAAPAGQVQADLRRRVPGHRSAPGRDPAAARRRRSPRVGLLARPRPAAGKLFIVGDPKQSIYRFRGTDVATYWRVSRQIEQHGGRRLQLTTSFRSVPAIQRFVNAAFTTRDGRQRQRAAARLRRAVGVAPAQRVPAVRRGAAGAEAVFGSRSHAEGVRQGDRAIAAGCDRRLHRVADRLEERLAGGRARCRRTRASGCRSSRGTSRFSSGGSPVSART